MKKIINNLKKLKDKDVVLESPLTIKQNMCPICGKMYTPSNSNTNCCSKQCLSEFVKG